MNEKLAEHIILNLIMLYLATYKSCCASNNSDY